LAHQGVGVVEIAEGDGLSGADGLAGRDDLAIGDAPAQLLGFDPATLNALHAIRAFFHHTPLAHRDIGVLEGFEGFRGFIRILEEIEAPHFIWAVVRAEARADTTVVDLQVQALGVVCRGLHRAYQLAGSSLTVYAGHWLEVGIETPTVLAVVAVDADPVHLPPTVDFLLADHWNVILRLAGDGAGVAADARIEVDDHSPLVA